MKRRHHRRMKYRSLLAVGMLTLGSAGCDLDVADDPAYLYAQGVASGVLSGLISVTVQVIGETLGAVLFPNATTNGTT